MSKERDFFFEWGLFALQRAEQRLTWKSLPWWAWGLSLLQVTEVSCQDLPGLSSSFLAFSPPCWQFSWEFCCFSGIMRGILFFKLFQISVWNFSRILLIKYISFFTCSGTASHQDVLWQVWRCWCLMVPLQFGDVQEPWGHRTILGILVQHQPISSPEVFQWNPWGWMLVIVIGWGFFISSRASQVLCKHRIFSCIVTCKHFAVSMAL